MISKILNNILVLGCFIIFLLAGCGGNQGQELTTANDEDNIKIVNSSGILALQPTPPTFSKTFSPDTIGPGNISTLIFTIDNANPNYPLENIAFIDNLPSGVTIATPPRQTNNCGGTLSLSTDQDNHSISFTDGELGTSGSCTITIDVTSSDPGAYTNYTDLTSNAGGDPQSATDDLNVVDTLPGFSMSFTPATVNFGGRSTLLYTIDNSANASAIANLDFTNQLPPGMAVADPANASTNCGTTIIPAELSAVPASSSIILDANGTSGFPAVAAGATCTVEVDIVGASVGELVNATELLADFVTAGKAADSLSVSATAGPVELRKSFINDPVSPGGTTTLEFTVINKSREDSVSGIAFTDDLGSVGLALLNGLTAILPPSPNPPCGAGSSLGLNGSILNFSGASLPPDSSCTFSVELDVPATAEPGAYTNTAGPVTGIASGESITGNEAGDLLFVIDFPVLTKTFLDNPVFPGDDVTLEFSITNTATTSSIQEINFIDELTDGSGSTTDGTGPKDSGFLPFPVSITLPPVPNPPCGADSTLALVSVDTDRQGLELTGGSLAASGTQGDTCQFTVNLSIPDDMPGGNYTNTTGDISAELDGGEEEVTGPGASDTLTIIDGPRLSLSFTDDPVSSGDTVTLEFTLSYGNEFYTAAATDIQFSVDLASQLTGLAAGSGSVADVCGPGNGILSGTEVLSFSGGTLQPGEQCTFSVELTVPASTDPGDFTISSSEVSAQIDGIVTSWPLAADTLKVGALFLTKEFLDNPVLPNELTNLQFTLQNTGDSAATGILFTDNLSSMGPGFGAVTIPISPCGGSTSGTSSFIIAQSMSVNAGETCTFTVSILVPDVSAGDYGNFTSSLTYTYDGSSVTASPAKDILVVNTDALSFTKSFIDDPVVPGNAATLEYQISNQIGQTITGIAFDDDLPAALLSDSCNGSATSAFPFGNFSYASASLNAGESCMIRVSVGVPEGTANSSFISTSTQIVGLDEETAVVSGPEAIDTLVVQSAELSKTFDGTVVAGGTSVLVFTIKNFSNETLSDLSFSDNIFNILPGLTVTGIPQGMVCGEGIVEGGTFVTLRNASVAAGDTCTFSVTLSVPSDAESGQYLNTTSELTQLGISIAEPATALLTVLD